MSPQNIKLYNSLTREKQVFTPIDENHVRIYACGPTVYNYAHIGNARMAVVFELLARVLRTRYPKVAVSLHQGTPEQVAQMILDDSAEIGMATERLTQYDDLVTLPCYEWRHVVVVPAAHPLARVERLTLEQIAAEPLISYHPSFTGRSKIDAAFEQRQLKPNFVLEAIDSDVIKTYVRLGLGVGIVAEMAVADDPLCAPGGDLIARPVGHLFGPNVARIAFKRGAYLRNFVYTFAELLSDQLTRPLIERAMLGLAADRPASDGL